MPKDERACLIIFSKTPQLGKVKTRLRSRLTEDQCLSLHTALLKDAIIKSSLIDADVHLYLTNPPILPFAVDVRIFEQHGNDLGQRMFHAFEESLKFYSKCVIIGTDSPQFPPERIQETLNQLVKYDVVLGPTDDGGYYLIGMNRAIKEPFVNIPWGTGAVMEHTLRALESYKVLLLDSCFDVDEPEDLVRLKKELETLNELYVRNTTLWFRQLVNQKHQS
jgi:rSAM/selenodomain-associated transferase 1